MPYRRLPNTDVARIRAMKTALKKGSELPPHKLAFTSKSAVQLQKVLPQFEQNIIQYRLALAAQNKNTKDYNEISRKARLYLTHFVRVMNMAIFRGDLPAETRAYYGLATNDCTVPSLNTENEMMSWGRRIIEGEELRIRKGGSPITNPTIAVVKVRFENYLEAWNHNNNLARKTNGYFEKNNIIRNEVDEIILQIWNEVEKTHFSLPEEVRKALNESYGIIYFYRKNEFNKARVAEPENQTWS
jgi:cation transport regulator ChaB